VKAGDLLRDFRRPSRADDTVKPYFEPDEVVFEWMAEAERQVCMRSRVLYDETTRDITRIAVAPGRTRYALDQRIREVVDVWVDRPPIGQPTSSYRLHLVDQSNAHRRPYPFLGNYNGVGTRAPPGSDYGNRACGGNQALREGNHLHEYSVDGPALVLYTIPDASFATAQAPAVLRLCTYRLPLKPIRRHDDCFEIPELHQDGLIHWLLYRFFDGNDGDQRNQSKADRALAQFTARFGELPSADVMRQQQEGNSSCTTYGGY
jgi:hypothetical protein